MGCGVTKPPPQVREWFAAQGRKNAGKKCPSRSRGGKEYYVELARLSWEARKAKAEAKAAEAEAVK